MNELEQRAFDRMLEKNPELAALIVLNTSGRTLRSLGSDSSNQGNSPKPRTDNGEPHRDEKELEAMEEEDKLQRSIDTTNRTYQLEYASHFKEKRDKITRLREESKTYEKNRQEAHRQALDKKPGEGTSRFNPVPYSHGPEFIP